ncbi:MAG TPA: response regulator [Pyrinomonadaceae bacterium]|nr:response regulator [Pyrinomonadaceae bacterium]
MGSNGERRGTTVLVVDDYADTRRVVRWMLEQKGYRVLEAEDGRQAVDSARAERPDLILMDLTMPQVDGFEAARTIRASEGLAEVPIIAVTAHDMAASREGARAAGCDLFISKPIDFTRLAVLIEKLLARQRQEIEHL